jgi:hypothetical protein
MKLYEGDTWFQKLCKIPFFGEYILVFIWFIPPVMLVFLAYGEVGEGMIGFWFLLAFLALIWTKLLEEYGRVVPVLPIYRIRCIWIVPVYFGMGFYNWIT